MQRYPYHVISTKWIANMIWKKYNGKGYRFVFVHSYNIYTSKNLTVNQEKQK